MLTEFPSDRNGGVTLATKAGQHAGDFTAGRRARITRVIPLMTLKADGGSRRGVVINLLQGMWTCPRR